MADALLWMDMIEEMGDNSYVLFTIKREIGETRLQQKGVGVVWNAKAMPGWPCAKIGDETDDCFNSHHYCDDKEGFQFFH